MASAWARGNPFPYIIEAIVREYPITKTRYNKVTLYGIL